ncbi:MAG: type II toxin-antitoxin system RatA family toxin [Oleiphilaceae bacterium]|nr:type II toxin-antitoxin system RatA family toxin [Oleiphilaceae bacterium]
MSLSIHRSALVMHSAEQMYALVNDIKSYPQFLPWCASAQLLEHGDDYMVASLEVSKGGVRQRFTTRNTLAEHRIDMTLVDGPFKQLSGFWEFQALREDACKVALTLNFELKQGLAKMAFGPVFNQAANSMVDAFCARAKQVYG